MKNQNSDVVFPQVGEIYEIKKTLYGGDRPDGYGKIRIYPPTKVHVDRIWTDTSHRKPGTNEIDERRMVALSDIDTLEEFPPVKIGALMHAAGLVEEESQEGRFVPPWQLHSGPEEEPETPMQRQLRVIKEQMLAEFSSATTDPTVVSELRSPLYFCGDVVAEAGRRIRVLGPLGEGFRVEVLGVGEFIVSREELCDAGPLPIQVQATA